MNYLQIYIDEIFAKPSDYSIIVRNIPENATKEDIEEMVSRVRFGLSNRELEDTYHLRIYDILMVKDLTEFLEVENRNLALIKKYIARK